MVTHRVSRGKRILVIDFTYTRPDGSKGRYRRDAEVQTRTAAVAEERRRLAAVAMKGTPFALVDETAAKVEAQRAPAPDAGPTFSEVGDAYWSIYAPTRLKTSTRISYRILFDTQLAPRIGSMPIAEVGASVAEFDAKLVTAGLSRSHRRHVLVVLRSIVCRFAVEAKYLNEPPRMPALPKKSSKLPVVISPDDAAKLIEARGIPSIGSRCSSRSTRGCARARSAGCASVTSTWRGACSSCGKRSVMAWSTHRRAGTIARSR